jgi:hypothetical protein
MAIKHLLVVNHLEQKRYDKCILMWTSLQFSFTNKHLGTGTILALLYPSIKCCIRIRFFRRQLRRFCEASANRLRRKLICSGTWKRASESFFFWRPLLVFVDAEQSRSADVAHIASPFLSPFLHLPNAKIECVYVSIMFGIAGGQVMRNVI